MPDSNSLASANLKIISYEHLPKQIRDSLTQPQKDYFEFAIRQFKIVGDPKVQSFQLGSAIHGKGSVSSGGLGYSITPNWSVFGGLGNINLNQTAINTFRTDVHLRLEDIKNGEKIFLEKSLPLPLTVSISSGDRVDVYFARGGFQDPLTKADFKLNDWSSFFLENAETNQIIPLSPIPAPSEPTKPDATNWIVGGSIALLVALFIFSSGVVGGGIFFLIVACLFLIPIYKVAQNKKIYKTWEKEYALIKESRIRSK